MQTNKTYLQSSRLGELTPGQAARWALTGLALSPFYWLLASFHDVPGLHLRWQCLRLGMRLLLNRQSPISFKTIYLTMFFPLDSTRHFELDFAWRALTARPPGRYLDVSSPRLLFALMLAKQGRQEAELINPDKADLAETETLLRAAGLMSRCRLHGCLIEDAPFAPASFDTISSISVVEHIPKDREAIHKIWGLLKPGGRFILTVPCATRTSEQYIDRDEYGLHGGEKGGHVFWQRFYDPALLEERIFSVTGKPRVTRVFGEREAGSFLRSATRKRTDRFYPFWREPYMVAQEYAFFDSVSELPGEGVIAMEFVKP
ncbi:MAG TPA: methyltransferase domain-containing protein [Verrucomicrobiae bacterium]